MVPSCYLSEGELYMVYIARVTEIVFTLVFGRVDLKLFTKTSPHCIFSSAQGPQASFFFKGDTTTICAIWTQMFTYLEEIYIMCRLLHCTVQNS